MPDFALSVLIYKRALAPLHSLWLGCSEVRVVGGDPKVSKPLRSLHKFVKVTSDVRKACLSTRGVIDQIGVDKVVNHGIFVWRLLAA